MSPESIAQPTAIEKIYPNLVKPPLSHDRPEPLKGFNDEPNNVFVFASHSSWQGSIRASNGEDVAGLGVRHQVIADQQFGGEGAGVLSSFMYDPGNLTSSENHAKDASDYAVGTIAVYLAGSMPAAGNALDGRMFSNANMSRTRVKDGYKTITTFGGAPVWEIPPSEAVEEVYLQQTYDTFHARVQAGIEDTFLEFGKTAPDRHRLIVDIHDTPGVEFQLDGTLAPTKLGTEDEPTKGFPLLLLSNRDGDSAHPFVMNELGKNLLEQFIRYDLIDEEQATHEGFEQNSVFKGGYTTERYGVDLENAYLLRGDEDLQQLAQHVHSIQVELNREMYMKQATADGSGYGIDEERLTRTQLAIQDALTVVTDIIRDLDDRSDAKADILEGYGLAIDDWRITPEPGTDTYQAAMSMPLVAATPSYRRAEPVLPKFRDQNYQVA